MPHETLEYDSFSKEIDVAIHDLKKEQDLAFSLALGKLEKVKLLLNKNLLHQPLYLHEHCTRSALGHACHYQQTAVIEYLLLQGATLLEGEKASLLPAQLELLNHQQRSNQFLSTALKTLKANYRLLADRFRREPPRCANAQQLLTVIDSFISFSALPMSAHLAEIKAEDYIRPEEIIYGDAYSKLDLYILLVQIYLMLNQASLEDFKIPLSAIFSRRENVILNTSLDYCYAPDSLTNSLCVALATFVVEPGYSPYNLLLQRARTEGREERLGWFDPIMGEEVIETMLPSAKLFFRINDNEIHTYEAVVEQAIVRLKKEKRHLKYLWYGTDAKNIKPVPRLGAPELALLKQRSPTLKKLIEYTERIDQYPLHPKDIIGHLSKLSDGLYAGDFRTTGNHKEAGEEAYAAVGDFAQWWSTLDPQTQNRVISVGNPNGNTLGSAISVILSSEDLNNSSRKNNAKYCVNSKSYIIDKILDDPNTRHRLQKIQGVYIASLSASELDLWQEQINRELSTSQSIFMPEKKAWPQNLIYLELTSFLISRNFVFEYGKFLGRSKDADTKTLIAYIFSEFSLAALVYLKDFLLKPAFDYLRQHQLSSHYYAYLDNARVKSSRHYAMIEEALSLQMLKVTATPAPKRIKYPSIATLCKQQPFIDNVRRDKIPFFCKGNLHLHFFGRNKPSALVANKKNLDEGLYQLDWKIIRLRNGQF